jgi:hypothetical protein
VKARRSDSGIIPVPRLSGKMERRNVCWLGRIQKSSPAM